MADPVFEAFRRKLADVVTVAINSGTVVSARVELCACPLGCHPLIAKFTRRPYPWAGVIERAFRIKAFDAASFVSGFESGGSAGPYAELGRLYRARFP